MGLRTPLYRLPLEFLPTDSTNPSVWVPRLANGSPRTGCRGCALALGSFRMLSPKSAHGLLATPGSWVRSENAPKRRRGGIGWSKTNEAVGHVGAEGRQRPRGRGRPARWRRGTRSRICSSPLRLERERRGYRGDRQETVRAQASRSARLRQEAWWHRVAPAFEAAVVCPPLRIVTSSDDFTFRPDGVRMRC
jgi:hypothetical protein